MNDGRNWGFRNPNNNFRGNRGGGRWRGGDRGSFRGGRKNFRDGPQTYGSYGGYRGRGSWSHTNYGNRNPSHWQNRQRPDVPGKRLSEEQIGVTEYMSDHKGFLGIIKSRYSDFQVAEINEEGMIAELNDLSAPAAPVDEAVDEDEDLLLTKYNLEILPMENWDSINKLAVSKNTEEKVEIDVSGMTKEQRTKIHDAVKKAFGDSIVGSTVNIDDKKMVRFEKYRKGVRIDNRVKWAWPGEYVYFIVYKENCDTMEAAVRIAERLRLNIKPSMLGYAGTKDRRAKTSQWFSLRKVDPRRVASACRDLRDVTLGNFAFRATPLRLGALRGNKFRIALRNVTADDEVVFEACRRLQESGFINYYGLQRFGTRVDTPTYDIGLQLLKANYREAINLIVSERHPERRGGGVHGDSRLLKSLSHAPNDLLGALAKLARNTRLLYLHSYQSLIWNRCVTERLRRLGARPSVGDLVPAAARGTEELPIDDLGEEHDDSETDIDASEDVEKSEQDGGETENKMEDSEMKKEENNDKADLETSLNKEKKIPVKILTQEDVDSGKYSIYDVILPLPGFLVEYPPNMKDFYEELLTKDGLRLDMKHKIKSYSLCGAYRRVVIRPSALTYNLVQYAEPHCDLLLSDKDKLEGRNTTGIVPDGKYKALLFEMTLPASCYATMALRELLKVDTSADKQALQNNYHKKNVEPIKTEEQQSETEKNGTSNKSEGQEISEESQKEEVSDVKEEQKDGEKRKLEENEEVQAKKLKQESDE